MPRSRFPFPASDCYIYSNGNVAYYCFIVDLGLKSNNHEILERIFNEELAVLSKPNEYYTGKHKNNFLGR